MGRGIKVNDIYDNPTKRFWYFLLIIAGFIILAFLLDKPETFFTSNYWRG